MESNHHRIPTMGRISSPLSHHGPYPPNNLTTKNRKAGNLKWITLINTVVNLVPKDGIRTHRPPSYMMR